MRTDPTWNLANSKGVTDFFESLHPIFTRALLYIVLAFAGVALAWAVGRMDVVASAPFRLVPVGLMKSIQATRVGVIERIEIVEGEKVEAGQPLFRL